MFIVDFNCVFSFNNQLYKCFFFYLKYTHVQIIQITNKSIQSIDGNFSDQPQSNDDDSCGNTSHILTTNSSPTTHTLNNQIKSPNSTTLNGYHSYGLANNSNYAQSIDQNASVSNYRRNCNVPMAFFTSDSPHSATSNRLSIHHPAPDIYDPEITTCCLPPPSPAPNSDRFIGIPPQHHQQVTHWAMSHHFSIFNSCNRNFNWIIFSFHSSSNTINLSNNNKGKNIQFLV